MKALQASAPGKAVLSGEYAVLEGAPAVAMAVDRRARVRIEHTGEPQHRVSSPGRAAAALFRAHPDGEIEWLEGAAAEFTLVRHVWRAVRPEPGAAIALSLDTRDFRHGPGGPKLGFGSSAALAVALASALGGGKLPPAELYRKAARAHREFQGGRGSGVDIATAVHGGVIAYRMDGRVEPAAWPAGLELAFLWSGRPVDTAAKLAQLAEARIRADRALAALVDAAGAVHAGWTHGADAVLRSLEAYTRALLRFSADSGLGIFNSGHDALYEEASRRGLVYKPCGAGGGDVGAVFARERAALDEFVRWAAAHGFEPLTAAADGRGVTREADDE